MQKRSSKWLAGRHSTAIVLAAMAGVGGSCSSKNPDALTEMNLDENQANDAMNAIASAPANSGDNGVQPVQSVGRDHAVKQADAGRPAPEAVLAREKSIEDKVQAATAGEQQSEPPEIVD